VHGITKTLGPSTSVNPVNVDKVTMISEPITARRTIRSILLETNGNQRKRMDQRRALLVVHVQLRGRSLVAPQ
jgi:hypothetical protein